MHKQKGTYLVDKMADDWFDLVQLANNLFWPNSHDTINSENQIGAIFNFFRKLLTSISLSSRLCIFMITVYILVQNLFFRQKLHKKGATTFDHKGP